MSAIALRRRFTTCLLSCWRRVEDELTLRRAVAGSDSVVAASRETD